MDPFHQHSMATMQRSAGYKHGCQTKKVMPGSVQDVARREGCSTSSWGYTGSPGCLKWCLLCFRVGSWNKQFLFVEMCWKCGFFQGFFLEANPKWSTWVWWEACLGWFLWLSLMTWKRPKFIPCCSPTLCMVGTSLGWYSKSATPMGISKANDEHWVTSKVSVPHEFFKFLSVMCRTSQISAQLKHFTAFLRMYLTSHLGKPVLSFVNNQWNQPQGIGCIGLVLEDTVQAGFQGFAVGMIFP